MNSLDNLEKKNQELRAKLGAPAQDISCAATEDLIERANDVLETQTSIRDHWRSKLETSEGIEDALFCLQFFSSIPLPIWSAKGDASISFWNSTAQRLYGFSAERAIGRNFVELFVADPEKNQANSDLKTIVNCLAGPEFFNLCKDKDSFGNQVYLVTCCFPVFDGRTNEFVQAEISFDLHRLPSLEQDLEEIYNSHKLENEEKREKSRQENLAKLEREKHVVSTLISLLFEDLKKFFDKKMSELHERIDANKSLIEDPSSSVIERETQISALGSNLKIKAEFNAWELDMKLLIATTDSSDGLRKLNIQLKEDINDWSNR